MRIRSTKPEFWRSKTIAQLDWDVRFVLKGLEAYVDDNGVGKDDLALIAADVFPRDLSAKPSGTLARLSEAVSALADAGLIVRYDIDGEDLLYIDKWKDIQRVDKPRPGRFPRPDGTRDYQEVVDRDSYRNPRGTFANVPENLRAVTGEQGNRGTGEEDDDASVAEVVVGDPSTHIIAAALGPGSYPSGSIRRLKKQVDQLRDEGFADVVIRQAVIEWDRRPNCDRPEFLPTVLADVVKANRSAPAGKLSEIEKQRRDDCPDCDEKGIAERDNGDAYRCEHPALEQIAAHG